MNRTLLTVERRLGETEILQKHPVDVESIEDAVQAFHDYYSTFWGEDTRESEYSDDCYERPDGAESVSLHSVREIPEAEFEVLSRHLHDL